MKAKGKNVGHQKKGPPFFSVEAAFSLFVVKPIVATSRLQVKTFSSFPRTPPPQKGAVAKTVVDCVSLLFFNVYSPVKAVNCKSQTVIFRDK